MEANGDSTGFGIANAGGNATGMTTNSGAAAASQRMRKRTKTGCLTCRKRRIKCGEEAPICNNCIKSKRTCEGYNQRLSWKPTASMTWPADAETFPYHTSMLPPQYRPSPPPIDTAALNQRQSRVGHNVSLNEMGDPVHISPPHSAHLYMQSMNGFPLHSPHTPQPPSWTPITPQYGPSLYGQSPMSADSQQPFFPISTPTHPIPMSASSPFVPNSNIDHMWNNQQRPSMPYDLPTPVSSISQDFKSGYTESFPPSELSALLHAPLQQLDGPVCWWEPPGTSSGLSSGLPDGSWASTAGPALIVTGPSLSTSLPAPTPLSARLMQENFTGATERLLQGAAVEYQDDDYDDVLSDEEMDVTPEETLRRMQHGNQDLSLIRSLHNEHMNELNMRRYDTFLYNGMLDHYRAEEHANPLRNPMTARVFAHFIFATGPSLSIFERHPRNPSAIFSENSAEYQRGLWTYTLPMMAIKHQGLLHAMLALSSLHIAKLQGTSITPSYKHYSYAIKRIHRSVGISNKKLLPTTIAATLLLGFYEILTADHLKWSSHLAGAKQLLIEVPFKRMAREARKLKAQQMAQKDQFGLYENEHHNNGRGQAFRDLSATIDESLVSKFMGTELRYDQFGQVFDEADDSSPFESIPAQDFDLGKYELYQDLYWWYARQDVYQAILSGNKLLLDFRRWSDCPPRASMGRQDAVFGTHDHLIILLGRISEFTARDRRRKIKSMEATGGQWRPPPGMNMPSPPGGPPPQQRGPPLAGNPNASHRNPSGPSGMQGGQRMGSNPMQNPAAMGIAHPSTPFDMTSTPTTVPMYTQNPNQQHPMRTPPSIKREHSFDSSSAPNIPFAPQPGYGQNNRGPPQAQAHPPNTPQMPSFYGMAPLPTTVRMPSSYASNMPYNSPSPQSDKSDYDLEVATQSALREWSQIRAALNTFESHLGPHFQPLPADLHPPVLTPFGPALFYRSHDIGIIWAMYNMACIIAHRCHPHMPPAAMMAAGVAAQQTAQYATRIGQIIGGIAPPTMGPDLSPSLGACLCEASLPLFFGGVQYQADNQRAWLVALLRNVELRTGWKSVGMVAQGCETSWEKAAEMGRGPPYTRKLDNWHIETAYDSRVARITGNYTALDHDHPDFSGRQWTRDNPSTRVHWAMGLLSVTEDEDSRKSRHVSGIMPSAGNGAS